MQRWTQIKDIFDVPTSVAVSLFGVFELSTESGTTVPISNRRARAILAMLCLVPEHSFSRRYLSKILWPDRFETQARVSLRQCLSDLGKLLAPFNDNILRIDRSRVSLNLSGVKIDLVEIEKSLEEGRISDAILGLGEIGNSLILDQLVFGPEFEVWLTTQRENAQRRLQGAVHNALSQLEASGDTTLYSMLMTSWEKHVPKKVK